MVVAPDFLNVAEPPGEKGVALPIYPYPLLLTSPQAHEASYADLVGLAFFLGLERVYPSMPFTFRPTPVTFRATSALLLYAFSSMAAFVGGGFGLCLASLQ